MDSFLTPLALLALAALGASMAVEDHRTTRVALWKLLVFTSFAALWALATGGLAQDRTTALVGLAVGGATGALVGFSLGTHLGRDALGGADTWILAAGGAILGVQWLGPWLGLATATGLVAFVLLGRTDPEHSDGRRILPFVPTLLATLLLLALGRALGLLPTTIL